MPRVSSEGTGYAEYIVAHFDYDGDSTGLPQLYQALVSSKLDYEYIGSKGPSCLRILYHIQSYGLRWSSDYLG